MKVLVVGCGSIGTRRGRILAKMGHRIGVLEPEGPRRVSADGLDPYAWYSDWAPLKQDTEEAWDAAVICTPPDSGRPEQIRACLGLGVKGLFVEKPLVMTLAEVDEIAALDYGDVVTMGACNLRWGYPQWNERCFNVSDVDRAAFHLYYPLDDWRPGARETYHRHGVVMMAAMHELDLAASYFGPFTTLRRSTPARDHDVFVGEGIHANGVTSSFHVDWSQNAGEHFRGVLWWLHGAMLGRVDDGKHFKDVAWSDGRTPDESYAREMRHFLECVEAGTQTCNPLRQAAEVCARALEVVS